MVKQNYSINKEIILKLFWLKIVFLLIYYKRITDLFESGTLEFLRGRYHYLKERHPWITYYYIQHPTILNISQWSLFM